MAASRLLSSFHGWADGRPELDPGIADMLVQLKATHLGDAQPGRWRRGDLETVLLEFAPEHVAADEDWHRRALPTARAFVEHAHREGLLHRGSAPLPLLLQELDAVEQQVPDVVRGRSKTLQAIIDRLAAGDVVAESDADWEDDPWKDNPLDDDLADDDWDDDPDDEEPDDDAIDPLEIESLRPVRLAPRDDLAAAARQSELLHELERLMTWVGVGRAVTDDGSLTREELLAAPRAIGVSTDASRFGAELDVEGWWRVELLWAIARAAGFVDDDGKALTGPAEVTLGQMLHEPGPTTDEYLLTLWAQAMAVVIGHDATGRETELVGEFVDRTATDLLFAAYDDEPQSVCGTVDGYLARPRRDLPRRVREKLVGDVGLALRTVVHHLHDLRAVTSPSKGYDDVLLTPLGWFGVREYALARGVGAPLFSDLARLDVPDFLRAVTDAGLRYGEETRDEIISTWFETRGREAATQALVGFARSATPMGRRTSVGVLHLGLGDALSELANDLAQDALLGPLTRAFLAEGTIAARLDETIHLIKDEVVDSSSWQTLAADPRLADLSDLMFGHGWLHADLTPADRDIMILESIAVAVEREGRAIRRDDLPPGVWALVDEPAVERLAAISHPCALQVMEAIGSGHPGGRIRKAAKKAAHKVRTSASPVLKPRI